MFTFMHVCARVPNVIRALDESDVDCNRRSTWSIVKCIFVREYLGYRSSVLPNNHLCLPQSSHRSSIVLAMSLERLNGQSMSVSLRVIRQDVLSQMTPDAETIYHCKESRHEDRFGKQRTEFLPRRTFADAGLYASIGADSLLSNSGRNVCALARKTSNAKV